MLNATAAAAGFDISLLSETLDRFSALTGMAAYVIDTKGRVIAGKNNFCDLCRSCTMSGSCRKCSAFYSSLTAVETRVTLTCHAGLSCFAIPLRSEDKTEAIVVGGQVFAEAPDKITTDKVAIELGCDPNMCEEKAASVAIADEQTVSTASLMLENTVLLAYNLYKENAALKSAVENGIGSELKEKIATAEKIVRDTGEKMSAAFSAFSDIENASSEIRSAIESTGDTVKEIQSVALNTKILGFNASIEASRAKEAGRGFGVIAQEVRNLAETSRTAADGISTAMKQLEEHTETVNGEIEKTKEIFSECMKNIEDFSAVAEEINAHTV